MNLTIASQAFAHNGEIPPRYTATVRIGAAAPPMVGITEGTKSLVSDCRRRSGCPHSDSLEDNPGALGAL